MTDQLDPRQLDFLQKYHDPKSETFSNAYKSAIASGYSEHYAKMIVSVGNEWIVEATERRKRLLDKAERKLEVLIDGDDDRIAADISKHITKTLGKEHYSEKTEVEQKGEITINLVNYGEDVRPESVG